LLGLVIARKTVNTRLDQNQAELGVLVLAIRLKVFTHGDSLLDQMPEVLRDRRCKAWASQLPSELQRYPRLYGEIMQTHHST
jgi:hypothetical protein